ncbi:MAG: pyridoxamine 5'-phosphate oxidase family protein [Thermoproteota archaeon]|jgi:general stress protein 26|nr:pyridoxamine 5'-phosphate oxidase family protein [Thermoproteota archaeon]
MFISKVDVWRTLKVIQAIPSMPKPVTETEVINFLESKLNIQIATIDEEGYPMIQPMWFFYHKESGMMYTCTPKTAKKVQNIRRNPDKIYFSIDDDNYPYKGVKGRAVATISEDIQKNLPIMERINMKYLGTLEHPLAKMLMENTRTGIEVAIEITPKFFSAWDFGKAM